MTDPAETLVFDAYESADDERPCETGLLPHEAQEFEVRGFVVRVRRISEMPAVGGSGSAESDMGTTRAE